MDGAFIVGGIIVLFAFYGISELFGRGKHIGKWWSFALLATSLIFGIVAMIASPSAKQEPTKGTTTHKVFGWICIVLGGISAFGLNPASLGLIVLGFYLIKLSKGEIINSEPKFYFNNSPQNKTSHKSIKDDSNSNNNRTVKSKSSEQDVSDYNKKIESLKKFRKDGVFSIEEYQRKLDLLNVKKHEAEQRKSLEDLKQTVDYKNLEELLNDGILSKEEFELKIDILRNKIDKKKKDESDLKKEKEKKITEEQKIKNKLYFLNQEFKANKISKEGFDRRKKQIENELDVLNFEKTTAYKNLHASYNSGKIHNSDYVSKYDEAFKEFKDKLKKDKEEAKKEKINYRYSAFLFVFIFGYPILLFKILEANRVDAIESTSIVIYYLISFLVIYLIKNIRLKIYSIILLSLILVFFNIDYSKLSSSVSSKKTSVSTNVKKNKTPKVKIDLKQKTIDFFEAENNRDMYKILDFFAYKKTKRYFDIYNPTFSDLGSEYRRQWKLSKSSNNEIIYVYRIKDREYKAKVRFTYTDKSNTKKEVINTLKIKYNNNNKIIEIYTIDSYKVPISKNNKEIKVDSNYDGYYIEKANIEVPLAVRNGPDITASKIYMCPASSIIYIKEYTNSKYYKVFVDGYIGYMAKSHLKKY